MKLTIHQILKYKPSEIKEGFIGKADVVFNDAVVTMNEVEIYLNRIIWELCIKYTQCEVTPNMSITHYYDDTGLFTESCFHGAISAIYKVYLNKQNRMGRIDKNIINEISEDIVDIIDFIHNHVSHKNLNHMLSLDVNDLLDAQLDTGLLNTMVRVNKHPSKKNISEAYDNINAYMKRNPTNVLPLMYLTYNIKRPQLNIMIGPRNAMSDINDIEFKNLVPHSMFMGMNKASWYFQESRTVAKAAVQSKEAIEQSDKMGRTLTLISSVIQTINMKDCGSKRYRVMTIADKKMLSMHTGKFYLDDDDGKTLKILSKDDTHLIGRKLKFRSVNHCNDKHVCLTCFGTLGLNIAPHANIGSTAVAVFSKELIQSHLSKKHHIEVSVGGELPSVEEVSSILEHGADNQYMKFIAKTTDEIKYYVKIPENCINVLHDAETMSMVEETTASSVDVIEIISKYPATDESEEMDRTSNVFVTTHDGNNAYFTNVFLSYMSNHTTYLKKNYIVDMGEWNPDDEFFRIMERDYNFNTLNKEMKIAMLNNKTQKAGNMVVDMDQFIMNIENLVNKRMKIHSSWIETFCTAFATTKDGHIPKNGKGYTILGAKVLNKRSFSAASNHDDFTSTVMNPFLFEPKFLMDAPADMLFRPDQMNLE